MDNYGVLYKLDEKKCRLPFYDIDDFNFAYTSTRAKKDTVYFGFELEYYVHGWNKNQNTKIEVANRIYDKIKDKCLLYFCKSTLDNTCTGEIVIAPLSYKYLLSDECNENMNEVLDIIRSEGGNETKKTGGHIHVSRMIDNNQANNMWKFAIENKEYFYDISGRSEHSKWAQFHKYRFKCHSDAINRDNRNTIEFRFWSGTLDFEVMKRRAIFCMNLQEYFRTHTTGTLDDIIKY